VDVGTGRTDSQYRQGQETHSEIILILFYSRSSLVSCSDEVQKQNGTSRFFSLVMSNMTIKCSRFVTMHEDDANLKPTDTDVCYSPIMTEIDR
jgi:hypothetical protein